MCEAHHRLFAVLHLPKCRFERQAVPDRVVEDHGSDRTCFHAKVRGSLQFLGEYEQFLEPRNEFFRLLCP